MLVEPIKVTGLAEYSRNLRKLDNDAPKGLRLAANAAGEIVVTAARPRVPTGPAKGGHAATSITTRSTRTAARVSEGGKRFPYMPWLDYGGRVGPRRSVVRPFRKGGRYLYPAYADNVAKVEAVLLDKLADVANAAGLEVD